MNPVPTTELLWCLLHESTEHVCQEIGSVSSVYYNPDIHFLETFQKIVTPSVYKWTYDILAGWLTWFKQDQETEQRTENLD